MRSLRPRTSYEYARAGPMTRMRTPLEFCVNGDGKPVQPPSWVLCKECLGRLSEQFDKLRRAVCADDSPRKD